MNNSPKHSARENKLPAAGPVERDINDKSQGSCPMYCPYGQPSPKKSKGSRTFLVILVIVCACFALGFGGWGIFLSVIQNQNSSESESTDYTTSESVSQAESTTNPVGTGTDSSYSGITLDEASDDEMSAGEIYSSIEKSIFQLTVTVDENTTDYGTAIVLSENGYLLTAAHVIEFSREADVTALSSDGKSYKATVVGYDSATDVAVLKIDAKKLTVPSFTRASSVEIGETVYNIAASTDDKFSAVLTKGIICSLSRQLSYDSVSGSDYIQTDAAIGNGGSGSVLVSTSGQIIGMSISNSYLSSDFSGESYSVPISQLRSVVKSLIQHGYVTDRLKLGVTGMSITTAQAAEYNVPRGVLIYSIQDDSVFTGTDVAMGDIITAIGGDKVSGMGDVAKILQKYSEGDKVTVTLYRINDDNTGSEFSVDVTLLADDGTLQK